MDKFSVEIPPGWNQVFLGKLSEIQVGDKIYDFVGKKWERVDNHLFELLQDERTSPATPFWREYGILNIGDPKKFLIIREDNEPYCKNCVSWRKDERQCMHLSVRERVFSQLRFPKGMVFEEDFGCRFFVRKEVVFFWRFKENG